MSGIRVHELAKDLEITSKEILEYVRGQGIEVKSHMSTIDEKVVQALKSKFKKTGADVSAGKPAAVPVKDIKTSQKTYTKPTNPSPEKKAETKKQSSQSVEPQHTKEQENVEKKSNKLRIPEAVTVKELAEQINCKSSDVIKSLMKQGVMATINQSIDPDIAVNIAKEFNIEAEVVSIISDDTLMEQEEFVDRDNLPARPPVVTVMGHVDHGKTSLLDAIRETKVTDREAGGITQHIGAYKVAVGDKEITFLDTPGHEAFTAMRARGAKVTDIVILVVAADDGVMPQTVEAINHAEAAEVPIIVAINKIDKPEANPESIKQKLTDYKLLPEEWGGDTIFCEVSAKEKTGIDNLLEMVLLQAEIMELKATTSGQGSGVVVEAKLDKGRGPVSTVLVQRGTLKIGQPFVVGLHYGKIRALIDDKGIKIKEAGPSTPVEILGFSDVPNPGDSFITVQDEKKARQMGALRSSRQRVVTLSANSRVTLDDLFDQINKGVIKELCIVIKADTNGSVQAISDSLEKLSTEDVRVKVIHGSAGSITESDVMLASASNAIIIGFNVRPPEKTVELAKKETVDIRLYTIIYKAISDIKMAMEGLLEPEIKENVLGRAEVREVFTIPKIGAIAGSYVINGLIKRNTETRLIRDHVIIYQGKITSLRRFKDDVKEVQTGFECGIGIEKFNDIKKGDIIEPFFYEEIARKLA